MKKWFKRGIFTLVTLFIVALISAAVFLLTFDPNAYKERVEELVYERYQRQLHIDGEIELSLFPRIGLSVADVSLSDRDSNQPFAAVDSARFAVAVWPLLWNRLVVDHVAVSGFKVWLARDEEGAFNFMDLLQRAAPTIPAPITASLAPITKANAEGNAPLGHDTDKTVFQIDIAGLDLREGEIHFSEANSQTQMRLVNLEINTGRMTFGQPFDVIFKGQLKGEKPTADATLEGQTVLQLEPQLRRYMAQRINVSLVGDIGHYKANSATLRGGLELLTLTEDLRARQIEFITQGRWQDTALPMNNTSVNITVAQLNIKRNLDIINTKKLKIRAHGFLPTTESEAEHKVELALDVPQLNIEPEQVQSEPIALSFKQTQGVNLFGFNTRISEMSGTLAQLKLDKVRTDIAGKNSDRAWKIDAETNAQAQVINKDINIQWHDMNASLRLDDEALNPNPAHAKLTGAGQWQGIQKQLQFDGLWQSANTHAQLHSTLMHDESWLLELEVDAKEMDVSPWLKSAELRQSQQEKLEQKKPAKTAASTAPMLPSYFNWAALQTQLKLHATELQVEGFHFQDLILNAQQKDGLIELTQLQSTLFNGELDATGSWHAAQAKAALKATLNHIDFELLSNVLATTVRLDGEGDLSLDLEAQGRTAAALRAGLDGSVALQVKDGRVVGWSFWQQLNAVNEAVRNMFSGQVMALPEQFNPEQSTSFNELAASVNLHQGQAQLKEFDLQAAGVKMKAESGAYIDLVNKQIHIALQADLQESTLATTEKPLSHYAASPLFITLSGPLKTPVYRWQWQRLEHPVVIEAIDNGLLEQLKGLESTFSSINQ